MTLHGAKWWARAILATTLRALRRIPTLKVADDRRYDEIEALLCRPGAVGTSRMPLKNLLYPEVVRESISRRFDYRIIDSATISADDRLYLGEHGLSLDFIVRNKSEPVSASAMQPGQPGTTAEPAPDFQLNVFTEKCIAAICPYSGSVIRSNRSFLAAEGAPIFYRFESHDVFYMAVGIPGIGYQKLYLYFPTLQTIVLFRSRAFWHGRANIDQLRAWLICEWRAVRNYIAMSTPPVVSALVDNPHFAHHLWNDLTGIDKVLSSPGLAQAIANVVVSSEPFGPIDEILPSLKQTRVARERFPTTLKNSLQANRLLIRVGDNHISDRVIGGLLNAANNLCDPDVRKQALCMRRDHWPILWVTIRTGNRTWVSQCTGIPSIINDLYREFPRLALIIDGFCVPYDHSAIDLLEQDRILQEEKACVRSIRARLDKAIPLRVNIGRPFPESVIFASIVDCYLTHHGSLQHKIGWIANCPGVVHSNRDDLLERSGRHRALSARSNAVVPKYLDPAAITDTGGALPKAGDKWNEHYANYDFDYRVARDELLNILMPTPDNPDHGCSQVGDMTAWRITH